MEETMRRLLLISLGVGVVWAVAAGCGKPGAGPVDGATAPAAGQAMGSSAESGAGGYQPSTSGVGILPACVTTSGDLSNPDGDPFPNDAIVTLTNCSHTGSSG